MLYTVEIQLETIEQIAAALLNGAEVGIGLDVDLEVMVRPESMRKMGAGFQIDGTYKAPLIREAHFVLLPRDQPNLYTFMSVVS